MQREPVRGALAFTSVLALSAALLEPTAAIAQVSPGVPSDEETLLDETVLAPQGGNVGRAGSPKPLEEPFCTECLLIGAGVGVTILGIPFIAISEIARNRKESLDAWVKVQGQNADLGFAPGYGFAKADDEQDRYLVTGLVITGIGVATLLTTVIVAASQGSRSPLFAVEDLPVLIEPSVAEGSAALHATVAF